MVICFITLLGGISILIFGLNLISVNTEEIANGRFSTIIKRSLKSPLGGLFTGTIVAGLTQSSVAVSVITISLVEAKMISFRVSAAVIMGANIGTTITAQLISLSSAGGGIIGSIMAIIGLLTGFSKNKTVRLASNAIMGLAVLFTGLSVISSSVKRLASSVWFQKIFLTTNPFLLFLNGIVLTGLTQSSSAITGVMVILGAGGVMPFSSAAFITLGSNVGSCFFVLLSSFNKNVQAKRSALFNLIFNLLGATLFFPILYFYSEQITALLINNNKGIGGAIADFHSAFNLICALVFFPFLSIFEKFIEKLVRVDDIKTKEKTFRDKRAFFN